MFKCVFALASAAVLATALDSKDPTQTRTPATEIAPLKVDLNVVLDILPDFEISDAPIIAGALRELASNAEVLNSFKQIVGESKNETLIALSSTVFKLLGHPQVQDILAGLESNPEETIAMLQNDPDLADSVQKIAQLIQQFRKAKAYLKENEGLRAAFDGLLKQMLSKFMNNHLNISDIIAAIMDSSVLADLDVDGSSLLSLLEPSPKDSLSVEPQALSQSA